jgi:phage host-nuclease inhibitor protein Gam
MPKTQQLTKDEISKLNEIRERYTKVIFEIGKLHVEENKLNEALNNVKEELSHFYSDVKSLEEKEIQFLQEIHNKYGEGTLDTGTYTISNI